MRIAHLSDPHLLSLAGARVLDFANKRWIGGLNLLVNRSRHYQIEIFEAMVEDLNRRGPDHILVTGDLTNVALEEEFRFARDHVDRLALGPREVTVIPGNHDAYVAAGLEHFSRYFGGFFESDPGWEWGQEGEKWPAVRVRGPVAVVGLSTSMETPWFRAWGRVGPTQLERLARALADPRLEDKLRIVAIHHPPAGPAAQKRVRGLRDYQAFAAVLAEVGAELVLHGHEHRDLHERLEGPGGAAIPVRGIPSATFALGPAHRRARYRIYQVDQPSDGRPQLIGESARVWDSEAKRFADA